MIIGNETIVLNNIAELIKLSVAPVFLLAAVAGLLNVFTGRLTRIIDKVDKLELEEHSNESHIKRKKRHTFLTMRMKNINLAIFFCASTGLLVALVIVTMFLSSLFQFKSDIVISVLFILAMVCLISSLLVFLKEIHYTTYFIRSKKNLYNK
ncbi:MAG: DUF2721 domain-containing protein [Campylobacterales bacterium]|nr:DUF2721 domain-containing protein [Campylobacterales bacterium]